MEDTFEWEGDWPSLMTWLDELTEGKYQVPFGHKPPIVKTGRNLAVTNRNDMFIVKPGESIRIDRQKGEFFAA